MPYDKSVVVPLPPDETFALITEPARLRRWNNVAARIDLRAGGDYRWNILPGSYVVGYVREVEPGKRVVLGWGPELPDLDAADPSTVTITLEPTADGTLVRLVHDGLPADQQENHAKGWNHYLDRLVVAGTTGDAGPDNWVDDVDNLGELDELKAAEAGYAIFDRILRGVTATDLANPTPCEGFTVADVLDHVAGSIAGLGSASGTALTRVPDADPIREIADLSQPALESWAARGLDGALDIGFGDMPASDAVGVLAVEYLVHAWDVATATGQKVEVDERFAAYVLGLSERVVLDEMRRPGFFDPRIELPPTAPAIDRLIAFTGRAA